MKASLEQEPKQLESYDRELSQRTFDGITVTLWWVQNTLDTYVTVDDFKLGEYFSVDVPSPDKANEVFMHPYSYRREDEGKA